MKKLSKQQREEQDRRTSILVRSVTVREAIFLLNKAANKLRGIDKYFDCSKDPDFDDLHHNVYSAISFLDFAYEELEEISERDHEKPSEEVKEKDNGRRTRNNGRKSKR
jgi:hypothetical protein